MVQLPTARLYGGLPNALLGSLYYPAVALAVWFHLGRPLSLIVLSIVAFAAATSAVLAYSLLFVTKRPCPYCWTAHVANWLILSCFCLLEFHDLFLGTAIW